MRALRRSFVLYALLCGYLTVLQAQRWQFAGHNDRFSYILENGSPAAVQTTDVAILYNGVPVTTDENNPASGPLFSPGLFVFGPLFLPPGTPVDWDLGFPSSLGCRWLRVAAI